MTKNEQNYIFLDILSLEDNHLGESTHAAVKSVAIK